MNKYKETVLLIDSDEFNKTQLVSILELLVFKLEIDTISGMAKSENKSPRGI
jgi:hypothetical protein